jgi:para-aminobenzoate synthetase/4-amino-4-deoxychorismate lyase
VKHCAYISNEYGKILSFSPELFFRKDSDTLTVRPMKGTIERGRDSTEDRYFSQKLLESEKDRAENVMIVDLLRNDLGRLSLPGSVVVKKLFEIEKYPTLFQMTSTIESKVPATISLSRLFSGLFPCGSITGAPKIESMKIIHKLEENFRGVYTGSIGFITPERDMVFNVAIRTLEIDGNLGKMGIGSGIVWDSDPVSEYRECFLKSRFLTTPATPEFEILETILWANKRYVYREVHLDRMEDSALYFDYRIDRDAMAQTLKEYEQHLTSVPRAKVRVLLKPDGSFTMESHPFFSLPRNGEIALSRTKTDSKDFFLYHKTTNRRFYNEQFQKAQELGFLDVIFLNEQNQLTEGAVHNLFIVKRGEILTPPARCGLLNGIYRKMLLKGFPRIREKALKIEDLRSADRIFLTNSVTGIRKVQWNGEWIQ